MSEKVSFKTIWHEAGVSALVLAAVCMAYQLVSQFLSTAGGGALLSLLSTLLLAAKIFACVALVRLYMYRFKQNNPQASRTDVRRLGTTIGVLSGFVLSALLMAYYMWNPETLQQAMDTAMQTLSQTMDRNQMDMLEKMMENLPQIAFFSNFFYCCIWAWVLPAILAPRIVSDNPFDDDEEDDDE